MANCNEFLIQNFLNESLKLMESSGGNLGAMDKSCLDQTMFNLEKRQFEQLRVKNSHPLAQHK